MSLRPVFRFRCSASPSRIGLRPKRERRKERGERRRTSRPPQVRRLALPLRATPEAREAKGERREETNQSPASGAALRLPGPSRPSGPSCPSDRPPSAASDHRVRWPAPDHANPQFADVARAVARCSHHGATLRVQVDSKIGLGMPPPGVNSRDSARPLLSVTADWAPLFGDPSDPSVDLQGVRPCHALAPPSPSPERC
jgi:hypothetical protein